MKNVIPAALTILSLSAGVASAQSLGHSAPPQQTHTNG